MTDENNISTKDGPPRDASTGNQEPGGDSIGEPDLEAVFRQWEQRRGEPATAADLGTDDIPLSAEELILDHEAARRPEAMVAKARKAAFYRLALMSLLAVVGIVALWANREDLAYYALSESDLTEMGDLRSRWKKGEREFPEMKHNSWVSFENGIMTEERESSASTQFFYDPMLHMVVVTTRELPEKRPGNLSLHSSFAELINGRWMFPEDLSAGFAGRGRLLLASEAPRRYRSIIQRYKEMLKLDERRANQPLWLFLDDVEPRDQTVYVGIFVMAAFVVLLSVAFYIRARRRQGLLEDALRAGQVA